MGPLKKLLCQKTLVWGFGMVLALGGRSVGSPDSQDSPHSKDSGD